MGDNLPERSIMNNSEENIALQRAFPLISFCCNDVCRVLIGRDSSQKWRFDTPVYYFYEAL